MRLSRPINLVRASSWVGLTNDRSLRHEKAVLFLNLDHHFTRVTLYYATLKANPVNPLSTFLDKQPTFGEAFIILAD